MRRNASKRTEQKTETRNRALHALARVRQGETLSEAARAEHIKIATVKKYVGRHLRQSSPGKRWTASKSDRLSAVMNVLTSEGMIAASVRGSAERSRLARYNVALAKWRRGERGAEKELAKFAGKRVGGLELLTDTKSLTTLEDSAMMDFDALYSALSGGA
jgi:hypothetical protein